MARLSRYLSATEETTNVRLAKTLPAPAVRSPASQGAAGDHEPARQIQRHRLDHAHRAGQCVARHRRRRHGQLRDHPGRRRQGVLGRRRLRPHRKEHEGLQRAAAHLEGSARHRLQRHQLLQADRQHHARPRRRRRPGRRHPGRRVDRLEEGQDHRRPHAARRRRRRPCRHRLAAALRHGQGQVLPAALRGGRRRGGRAHRPGLALRRGRPARSQGPRGRHQARRRRADLDPLHQVRAQQLAAHDGTVLRRLDGARDAGLPRAPR